MKTSALIQLIQLGAPFYNMLAGKNPKSRLSKVSRKISELETEGYLMVAQFFLLFFLH